MSFIKKLKHQAEGPEFRYHLHKHLAGLYPGRDYTHIHASELTKDDPENRFCGRQWALMEEYQKSNKQEFIPTCLKVTFALGFAVEDLVVGWFADMGMVIGTWCCVFCNKKHHFQKRPVKCSMCNFGIFKHEEERFISEKTGASCGIDLLLNTKPGLLTPVELKSIDKIEFKSLSGPLAEHRLRTRLYLRIIAEHNDHRTKMINTQEGLIMYVSKGGYGVKDPKIKQWDFSDWQFSPFKEYRVIRNDEATEHLCKLAEPVKVYRDGGPIPKRICNTAFHPRAAHCPVRKLCFSKDVK